MNHSVPVNTNKIQSRHVHGNSRINIKQSPSRPSARRIHILRQLLWSNSRALVTNQTQCLAHSNCLVERDIAEIVITGQGISIQLSLATATESESESEHLETHLSYISNVPCNEVKVGCAGNSPFNRSASARNAHPLDEISPGTTYASENSEKY